MKKLLSIHDGRHLYSCLLFLIILFGSYKGVAQSNTYSDVFIENCIREVYGNKADELVFNSNSRRLVGIQDFFNNRLSIVSYDSRYDDKGIIELSSLGLFNKYNNQLSKDDTFNPSTFNPLKYKIEVFPSNTVMYKVGNTGYIIIVKPSRIK